MSDPWRERVRFIRLAGEYANSCRRVGFNYMKARPCAYTFACHSSWTTTDTGLQHRHFHSEKAEERVAPLLLSN